MMPPSLSRAFRHGAAALSLVALLAPAASAQYFGRNKVHYETFDFEVLRTEHFDIYFYPEAREGVEMAARMSERWLARLERVLQHELRGRQSLILYASQPHFQQTNTIGGEIGEGTGGVTESLRRRIILPFGGSLAATDHVIGHELVHAFQFDITARQNGAPGESGAHHLPLWFVEGMAEYLSIGPVDANTAMWLRDAVRSDELPTIEQLDDPKYFPYRWGQAFWAYVTGRWGDSVLPQMLLVGGESGDYRTAIEQVLGMRTEELSEQWQESIRAAYTPIVASRTPPSEAGRRVLAGGRGLGGDLNIAPSISPDGRWIAFLSERSLFSIDLFIADAVSGEVVRRLTSTATDPHMASLQFIHSAGAWDAESRRLAVATISRGRPAIAIYNPASGEQDQEIPLETLDEIFNPTWAPDGGAIAFTGMKGGLTDLYVYEFETAQLRRLTEDPYTEIQPAWSPDGSRIAFATDRFSSQLETLSIGDFRLALIDPQTGRVEPVSAFTRGKNINPQWAPDSRSLYFISDRDGVPNLYRASPNGAVVQITTLSTGVTGITASSPALSVASQTGLAAFSLYDGGNHHVYTLEVEGRGEPPDENAVAAAVLPPVDRLPSSVAALLNDESYGLPPVQEYEVTDYDSRLSLAAVGPPVIGVGASRFGTAVSGGIALYFSDMLGDRNLITAFEVSNNISNNFSLRDASAQVAYTNQKNRWLWGLLGGQSPYLSGGFRSSFGELDGSPVLVDETIVFRQTERTAAGVFAYPFSRAQRVEFQGGASQYTFDQIVRTQAYSLVSGQLILDESETTQIADPLAVGTASAALVYDTSLFGATSPIQGQRYRFEASPTFGGITYTSALLDYRRYFMPAPFYTLAGRVMHYGRYGSGSEDQRLFPLYLGYPSLVRGYDQYSFSAAECVPNSTSTCPVYDRLLGSRLLLGNLEFRFPLLRPFGASRNMYGPIPVEVAFFGDAGVAWDQGETPELFGGSRQAVSSAGVAFRINVLGFMIAEFDVVRPFNRPGKGTMFTFQLTAGGF
jgi:Tol biopolymer transport system component